MPSAMSSEGEPVEITGISRSSCSWPMTMIEPLPNCFSIDAIVRSTCFCFSSFGPVGVRDMASPSDLWGDLAVFGVRTRPQWEVGQGNVPRTARGEAALVEYDFFDGPGDGFRRRDALELDARGTAQPGEREVRGERPALALGADRARRGVELARELR